MNQRALSSKCRVVAGQRFPRTRPAKNLLVICDEKVAVKYENLADAFPPFGVLRRKMSEPLIRRYEHHGFKGWAVCATRRNKRFTRYFSDHPNGQRKALQAARAYRDKLLSRLPPLKKIRIVEKRNTTGVMGVWRQEVLRKSGRWFARYIAEWPNENGTSSTASFSVNLASLPLSLARARAWNG